MKNLSHTPRSWAIAASSGETKSRSPWRSRRPEPLELGQRVAHLEIEVDAECLAAASLDPRFELVGGGRRGAARRKW